MEPKFKAEQLVILGRHAGPLKAGTVCRVLRVVNLNSAVNGAPWFRYLVGAAMPYAPEPEVCWERDLAPVESGAER